MNKPEGGKPAGDKPGADRRTRRTRQAIIHAFNELILKDRKKHVKVGEIVERANVGRSTFYEHFANGEDVHLQALSRPLSALADAIVGAAGPEALAKLLTHFWENRQRARVTFGEQSGERVVRLLARLIEDRLAGRPGEPALPPKLIAMQLAQGQIGLIRSWVAGEAPATPERLAAAICDASRATLASLHEPALQAK